MEITITRDSPVPLRVQLLNQLHHLILSRQWSPGYHIPSEPELKRQLTTMAQDGFAIGERAAKLLIERIEGDDSPPRQEIVDTQLIIRASTAPPFGCTR